MKKSINIRKIIREEINRFIIYENMNDEMMAYHGTTHDFDKFSTDFMGQGQGSQAYGWGIYVTQSEKTGKYYAEVSANNYKVNQYFSFLKNRGNEIIREVLTSLNIEGLIDDGWIVTWIDRSEDFTHRPMIRIDMSNKYENLSWEYAKEVLNTFDEILKENSSKIPFSLDDNPQHSSLFYLFLEKLEVYATKTVENEFRDRTDFGKKIVYQVDIPDDNGHNYFYWETYVSKGEFYRIFISFLKQKGYDNIRVDEHDKTVYYWNNGSLRDSIYYGAINGCQLYKKMADITSSENVSKYLSTLGFVGITMPIGYIHGITAEDGARNYVIFNANSIKIIKKTNIEGQNENE